jgi:hypothetical protein
MATEVHTSAEPGQELSIDETIAKLRELFADAPEVGKKALESALKELASQASETPPRRS